MKVILLFGPPGIGKSTIVKHIQDNRSRYKGYAAFDLETISVRHGLNLDQLRLEEMYGLFRRVQTNLSNCKVLVVGAAALDPSINYGFYTDKVLLTTSTQEEYDKRRARRDSEYPGKANQAKHNILDWEKGVTYDAVVITDDLSVDQTIAYILSEIKH